MSIGAKKHDRGKTRYDLIPADVLEAIGGVYTHGAQKYADRNWEAGFEWGRLFGAAQRHMWKFWNGEDLDADSGLLHLSHANCCLQMLLAHQLRGLGRDDRANTNGKPKRVYISGPFRARTQNGVRANLRRAVAASKRLWMEGYWVFCPHGNTGWCQGLMGVPDQAYLDFDLDILQHFDAIYMLVGWEKSEGAVAELAEATRLGLEIMYAPGAKKGE